MGVKNQKSLVFIGLLCSVSLAYASPIKDSEMLKHHRGMQSINHTKCTKVSTYTIAIKRHRGMNSIRICDNILIREKIGENAPRHRGEQKV
ncbi:MAG: hypothetical protein Q8S24_04225 [Eubacteriales bacterium]|nr:hypothetical protein [Eubacteriales bacterium]